MDQTHDERGTGGALSLQGESEEANRGICGS